MLVWTCRSPFILNGNVGLGAPSLHLSIKVMNSHSSEHQETIVVFITVLFSVNSLTDSPRCCHSVLDYGFYPIRAQRRRQQAASSAQSAAMRPRSSTDTANGLIGTGRHFLRTSWRSPSHLCNKPFGWRSNCFISFLPSLTAQDDWGSNTHVEFMCCSFGPL